MTIELTELENKSLVTRKLNDCKSRLKFQIHTYASFFFHLNRANRYQLTNELVNVYHLFKMD